MNTMKQITRCTTPPLRRTGFARRGACRSGVRAPDRALGAHRERPPERPSWLPPDLAACSPAAASRRSSASAARRARCGCTCSASPWSHRVDGGRLRRHGGGAGRARAPPPPRRRHVPSWRVVAGVDTLERPPPATAAIAACSSHERYYAGRARVSLELLLPLTAAETKRRLLAVAAPLRAGGVRRRRRRTSRGACRRRRRRSARSPATSAPMR